eukprot:3933494-Pleurochrysis_carterae.AAC.1
MRCRALPVAEGAPTQSLTSTGGSLGDALESDRAISEVAGLSTGIRSRQIHTHAPPFYILVLSARPPKTIVRTHTW